MGHGLAAAAPELQQQQQQQHVVTWLAVLISRHLTLCVSGCLVGFRGLQGYYGRVLKEAGMPALLGR
jgi:hypothetical protein